MAGALPSLWHQPGGKPDSPDSNSLYPVELTHQGVLPDALSVTEPNWQRQVEAEGGGSHWGTLRLLLTCPQATEDKSQSWCTAWSFLHAPKPSRGIPKIWINCSSKQVARGQQQAASYTGLHQSPFQEAQNEHTSGQLQTASEQNPVNLTSSISKGDLGRHPILQRNPALCGRHLHISSHSMAGVELHSQPA